MKKVLKIIVVILFMTTGLMVGCGESTSIEYSALEQMYIDHKAYETPEEIEEDAKELGLEYELYEVEEDYSYVVLADTNEGEEYLEITFSGNNVGYMYFKVDMPYDNGVEYNFSLTKAPSGAQGLRVVGWYKETVHEAEDLEFGTPEEAFAHIKGMK